MRTILATNIRALLTHHYKNKPNITQRQRQLALDARVSFSTVQRIMESKTGASLDNLEAIATALGLSAYQLLIPSLQPHNPQIVKGATKEEERLYASWRKSRASVIEAD